MKVYVSLLCIYVPMAVVFGFLFVVYVSRSSFYLSFSRVSCSRNNYTQSITSTRWLGTVFHFGVWECLGKHTRFCRSLFQVLKIDRV